MLKNADYIYNNVIIADEINTTKKYCKKATGVDLSVKDIFDISKPGIVFKDKTIVYPYTKREKKYIKVDKYEFKGWFLPQGSYILFLNEGCRFGPKDVGYIVLRSSFNRNSTSVQSAIRDPSFSTKNERGEVVPMSIRLTVDTPLGIYIEENSRVGQLLVWEIEDGAEQYNGQWAGGVTISRLAGEK